MNQITMNKPAKSGGFDVNKIRAEFPILKRKIYEDLPLVYLDSAASAQKPQQVLDAMMECYTGYYSNIHRGLHRLAEDATSAYEETRAKVAGLINAPSPDEVVLTTGGTFAINLIAQGWGSARLKKDDEILISIADHHANIVPWQMLCERTGARLIASPVNKDGSVTAEMITKLITKRTKIVSLPHVSNVLGTVFPIAEVAKAAKASGAIMVVDGCQGVVHLPVDVKKLGCDFYVFSGHKLYAPSGIGALWGKAELLADMAPLLGGGEMIDKVTIEKTTYAPPPHRFEAGTPPIAEAVGLGAAINFVQDIGMENIRKHEQDLITYAHQRLSAVEGLNLIGTAPAKSGVVSFTMEAAHPHDIATIIDRKGVAIRAGHHCAQPLMDFLEIPATARASVAIYTTKEEFDILGDALETVRKIFD